MKLYKVYNLRHELLFKGSSMEVVKAGYVHSSSTLWKHAQHGTSTWNGYRFEAEDVPKAEPLDPICITCGRTFKGSMAARYCPTCRRTRAANHHKAACKYIPSDELGEAMHDCIEWCLKNNKPTYSYGAWVMAGRPTVW